MSNGAVNTGSGTLNSKLREQGHSSILVLNPNSEDKKMKNYKCQNHKTLILIYTVYMVSGDCWSDVCNTWTDYI